jgi:hypothetical protein
MKFNWPAVVDEFRVLLMENVQFTGIDREHTLDLIGYFRMTVRQTDTFHPFNTDRDLDIALRGLPERCDYRSVKRYWAWKNGRMQVEDAVYEMLMECKDTITDHFADPWNFPPGYRKPVDIKFVWDGCDMADVSGKAFSRIIRAAKRP